MGSGSDRFRIFILLTQKAESHVFVLIQSTGESEATCRMSRLPKSTSSQVCPNREICVQYRKFLFLLKCVDWSLIFHRCYSTFPPLSPLIFPGFNKKLCTWSVTFCYGSGSADPYHCITDPEFAIFFNGFWMRKNQFFSLFLLMLNFQTLQFWSNVFGLKEIFYDEYLLKC